jgi:hypothetical protein
MIGRHSISSKLAKIVALAAIAATLSATSSMAADSAAKSGQDVPVVLDGGAEPVLDADIAPVRDRGVVGPRSAALRPVPKPVPRKVVPDPKYVVTYCLYYADKDGKTELSDRFYVTYDYTGLISDDGGLQGARDALTKKGIKSWIEEAPKVRTSSIQRKDYFVYNYLYYTGKDGKTHYSGTFYARYSAAGLMRHDDGLQQARDVLAKQGLKSWVISQSSKQVIAH